jgi:hypothetical protein
MRAEGGHVLRFLKFTGTPDLGPCTFGIRDELRTRVRMYECTMAASRAKRWTLDVGPWTSVSPAFRIFCVPLYSRTFVRSCHRVAPRTLDLEP